MTPIQQLMLGVGAKKKTYLDDVFSTYLYKGTGSALTINNGIDESGEGALTWIKRRNSAQNHFLQDTVRGATKVLRSNTSETESTESAAITAFNNNGFTLGTDTSVNSSGDDYSSFSFRKAKGFFDVVTYTGNDTAGRTISHSLSSAPGCVIVKCTTHSDSWQVWHRDTGGNQYTLELESTNARMTETAMWNSTAPTASSFTLGNSDKVNGSGRSYVAYVFAGGESTAATARSVDFDGSGDYFETNSSSDYTLGTGDFTLEYWIKQYESAEDWVVNAGTVADWGTNGEIMATYCHDSGIHRYKVGTTNRIESTTKLLPGQWNHVAIVRSSGTVKMYINGTKEGVSYSDSTNYTFTDLTIGRRTDTSYTFNGSLSNLRLVVGTAVYTSSFKPPTEPLTNITNTKLLCFNNSSTTGTTVGTITANGDPTASTNSPFDDPAAFTFGESGSESVVKCGSYVGNSSTTGPEINLGWEPQWVMIKSATSAQNWILHDSMRGIVSGGNDPLSSPDQDNADYTTANLIDLTSTGFKITTNWSSHNESGETFVYIAIRRPDGYVSRPVEDPTKVFSMDTGNGSSTIPSYDSGFPVDFGIHRKNDATQSWYTSARLIEGQYLVTDTPATEVGVGVFPFDSNTGWAAASNYNTDYVSWMWKRHAGMDVVTYDGSSASSLSIPHSLNAVPEMIFLKCRSEAEDWRVWHKGLNGGTNPQDYYLRLNATYAEADAASNWNDTAPTSTHFTVGNDGAVNNNNRTYLAMLFASVNGISKVGYFSGDGTSNREITTGFQPRLLIIRSVTSTASWSVLDTQRGWTNGGAQPVIDMESNSGQANRSNWFSRNSTSFTIVHSDFNDSSEKYIYYAHA